MNGLENRAVQGAAVKEGLWEKDLAAGLTGVPDQLRRLVDYFP